VDKIDRGEPCQKGQDFEQYTADRVAFSARVNEPQKVPMRKRAAIYARTAISQKPEGGDFALADQVRQCQLYCHERGYTVEERHIYCESGSGSLDTCKLPRYASMHEAARRHEFDAVVLVSLDRLSRNQAHRATLLNELAQCEVTIECVNGDTSVLFLEIKRYVAGIERARIAARAAQGRTARKAKRKQQ
jgi:DNA invertase Pin-like site-specific DNA recombinase